MEGVGVLSKQSLIASVGTMTAGTVLMIAYILTGAPILSASELLILTLAIITGSRFSYIKEISNADYVEYKNLLRHFEIFRKYLVAIYVLTIVTAISIAILMFANLPVLDTPTSHGEGEKLLSVRSELTTYFFLLAAWTVSQLVLRLLIDDKVMLFMSEICFSLARFEKGSPVKIKHALRGFEYYDTYIYKAIGVRFSDIGRLHSKLVTETANEDISYILEIRRILALGDGLRLLPFIQTSAYPQSPNFVKLEPLSYRFKNSLPIIIGIIGIGIAVLKSIP